MLWDDFLKAIVWGIYKDFDLHGQSCWQAVLEGEKVEGLTKK